MVTVTDVNVASAYGFHHINQKYNLGVQTQAMFIVP